MHNWEIETAHLRLHEQPQVRPHLCVGKGL
uniref:Uncharacterized protein n=1 Tax=Anguilla anguilla TaxID=7936 RepID=A0A0E9T2T1_ANGAN